MIGVFENRNKTLAEASVVGREHVAQPMERLGKAHGGTGRPVMSAGGGSLKVEGEIAEGEGARRRSVSTAMRAGTASVSPKSLAGEAIDYGPNLALPSQRVDHVAWIGIGGLPREPVVLGAS